MQMSESKENYLEAIYTLSKQQGTVLAVDIAGYLNVSKPSVSLALKDLVNCDFVKIGLHNAILLTATGTKIAGQIHERRCFFASLLSHNGMDETKAQQDAKRLMHAISEEGFRCLKEKVCIAFDSSPVIESVHS